MNKIAKAFPWGIVLVLLIVILMGITGYLIQKQDYIGAFIAFCLAVFLYWVLDNMK